MLDQLSLRTRLLAVVLVALLGVLALAAIAAFNTRSLMLDERKGQIRAITQGAYTVTDLVVGWQATPKLDVQLNINNVFDKKYYNALSGSVSFPSNVYGEPRNAMLSARYQF